jgi:hypothetical protein
MSAQDRPTYQAPRNQRITHWLLRERVLPYAPKPTDNQRDDLADFDSHRTGETG